MEHHQSVESIAALDFTEKSIRRGFIRKVYGILTAQLMVTFAIVAIFSLVKEVKEWIAENPGMLIGCAVATVVLIIVLACCGDVRRKAPLNFILLALFTLCEGLLVGSCASYYAPQEVLIAVGITVVLVLMLTLFALQTKIDFTLCSGFIFTLLLVMIMFGIFAGAFPTNIAGVGFASLGAFIFCMYLIIDTQMMMGGKHRYSISPEEYIFAALNLYLDVINIFLYILRIVGK